MSAYFSEINYDQNVSQDFIEIVVPTGTDTTGWAIYYYKEDGTVNTQFTLGTLVSTSGGKDVYLLDNSTAGFTDLGATKGYALVDDVGTVHQFITFDGTITAVEGPANGLTSVSHGDQTTAGQSMETTDGGTTYSAQSTPSPGSFPCYGAGTLIDTFHGPRPVEDLRAGDLVDTLDHGPLPNRWTRWRRVRFDPDDPADARPVLIRAGALGPGRPARDLVVSPQHRLLVGASGQLDGVFGGQVYAPAKALTVLPGIRHMQGLRSIDWFHFALDSHEVVTANGCLSESLLLGPMVLRALSRSQRCALDAAFGGPVPADAALNGPAARDCLRVSEVRRILAEHGRRSRSAGPRAVA